MYTVFYYYNYKSWNQLMKNQPATKSIMHGITVLADEVVSVLPLPVLEPTNPETAPISVVASWRYMDGATKTLRRLVFVFMLGSGQGALLWPALTKGIELLKSTKIDRKFIGSDG